MKKSKIHQLSHPTWRTNKPAFRQNHLPKKILRCHSTSPSWATKFRTQIACGTSSRTATPIWKVMLPPFWVKGKDLNLRFKRKGILRRKVRPPRFTKQRHNTSSKWQKGPEGNCHSQLWEHHPQKFGKLWNRKNLEKRLSSKIALMVVRTQEIRALNSLKKSSILKLKLKKGRLLKVKILQKLTVGNLTKDRIQNPDNKSLSPLTLASATQLLNSLTTLPSSMTNESWSSGKEARYQEKSPSTKMKTLALIPTQKVAILTTATIPISTPASAIPMLLHLLCQTTTKGPAIRWNEFPKKITETP